MQGRLVAYHMGTITRQEYLKHIKSGKKGKGRSRANSTTYTSSIHGTRTFGSKLEAQYCEQLDWELQAGEIKHYDLQVKLPLHCQDDFICNYYIDFLVTGKHGEKILVEVKGYEFEVWRLKWKLCLAQIHDLHERVPQLEGETHPELVIVKK